MKVKFDGMVHSILNARRILIESNGHQYEITSCEVDGDIILSLISQGDKEMSFQLQAGNAIKIKARGVTEEEA